MICVSLLFGNKIWRVACDVTDTGGWQRKGPGSIPLIFESLSLIFYSYFYEVLITATSVIFKSMILITGANGLIQYPFHINEIFMLFIIKLIMSTYKQNIIDEWVW